MTINVITVERISLRFQIVIYVVIELIVISSQADFIVIRLPDPVSEMQGKHIKLPGFIVPLDFDDNQVITEFFLVPYFGACLHLPPPPPNQIIYISHPDGIEVDALYDPFWLYGTLDTGIIENTTAKSAYRMRLHHIEPYYE